MRVLAIDPGREKCGVAVCEPGRVLHHAIVPAAEVGQRVQEWVRSYRVEAVLLGDRTGSRDVQGQLADLPVPVVAVDERGSTLAARQRYFQDRPPRGWRRLLPRSFQVPPEPYDDYAAMVLAEAYLRYRGIGNTK